MPPVKRISRLSVSEYGAYDSVSRIAKQLGVEKARLFELLSTANTRISQLLSIKNPIEFDQDRFRVVGVAGLLRLSPRLELEVVPKFLSPDDLNWREDFFFIATIARFGRILPKEALLAGLGSKGDLADLIGYTVVGLYKGIRSRPLWTYRQRNWTSLEVDGELDPESVVMPESEGFVQSSMKLDRENRYNWVILRAIDRLLAEVRVGSIRHQLSQIKHHLSPQREPLSSPRTNLRVPSRHVRWQDLVDLSEMVLEGFGISLKGDVNSSAPGYIVKTADIWESLVFLAAKLGLQTYTVNKGEYELGTRVRFDSDSSSITSHRSATVTPDVTARASSTGDVLLFDAKYRSRLSPRGEEVLNISPDDLYESLAFLTAANASRICLIYPVPSTRPIFDEPGMVNLFERIDVGSTVVLGLAAEVRNISAAGGFRKFYTNFSQQLLAFADRYENLGR